MKRIINGFDLQGMLLNALNNLINAEKTVNSMNVFPVADGDTGTNMRLTVEHGYSKAVRNKHLGRYLKDVSTGMLLGARGNSGVILSQLVKGLSDELYDKGIVNSRELKNGFIRAYQTAYKAVVNPVEGTILTVVREGIENIKDQIRGDITIEKTLLLYLNEMNRSLKRTPELLPTLKEASVLDSGGYGYILIIEGMYKYLIGEIIKPGDDKEVKPAPVVSPIYFDEKSEFIDGYCMEFLLQLLESRNYKETFELNSFINSLKGLGNSLVVLQDESIVKVHVHTLNPSKIIELCQNYGEFITFKLENMQLQHNEFSIVHKKDDMPKKDLGIIAVINGNQIENNVRDLGADIVISASGKMNVSSNEFLDAINSLNAKKIVIFPNNINTFGAANQAIDLARSRDRVFVIPSKSMMECFVALQMDIPDADINTRIAGFNENIKVATTIVVTTASKNYETEEFCCKIGDKIGLINETLVSASHSEIDCLEEILSKVENIDEKTGMIIYLGKDASDDLEDKISDLLSDKYPSIEYQICYGEQETLEILIGLL